MPKKSDRKIVATNRKARHQYEILDTYEAGIALVGSEVKSLRTGRASLEQAFAVFEDGEAFLIGMHIPEYSHAGYSHHGPTRQRKLLLHRKEIDKLYAKTRSGGLTLVPLTCYFRTGLVKVELALAKGRKLYDKRAAIREREDELEAQRALRRRR